MLEWWTNRSRPPSSGVMKPKPFSSLNHLTVPVAIDSPSAQRALEPIRAPNGPDHGQKPIREGCHPTGSMADRAAPCAARGKLVPPGRHDLIAAALRRPRSPPDHHLQESTEAVADPSRSAGSRGRGSGTRSARPTHHTH